MKNQNTTPRTRDASIDLGKLDRDGAEVEALLKALERAEAADAGFGRQFVASGVGKCPAKPSA
jgi:hypothetical protein